MRCRIRTGWRTANILAVVLIAACHAGTAEGAAAGASSDSVFDLDAILAPPLAARVLKSAEADGIVTEEVMFHSEMDGEKSVDIFAFFCYPKGARGLPAFIWNQSGAAAASTYFPLLGAKRGYAAMCIDLPIGGYRSTGGYPINSGLSVGEDPRRAPIYHGAVALLRAVSFLQSRAEVDPGRIGMVGSSWGGFFTTLMVGIDPRLKAGSAMFGCGGLHLGNAWWDGAIAKDQVSDATREHWRTTLDPALRLAHRKTPMAWFSGTNDVFYWMPALMHSFGRAAGPKHLSLMANWDHGLPPQLDEQVFVWLDVHLKGAAAFIRVSPLRIERRKRLLGRGRAVATWDFDGPREVESTELLLSYGRGGNWPSRYWKRLPAQISKGVCTAALPQSPMPYWITGSVVDADGFRYSTPMMLVEPRGHGLFRERAALRYNGCSVWGDFEEDGVAFLRVFHVVPKPEVSPEAHGGRQSLVVRGGLTLRYIYYTTGIPHRFSCWVKADTPTEVTVELKETYDGKSRNVKKAAAVGERWTEVALEHTPAESNVSQIIATIRLPDGASMLLDDVSFSPVTK